MHVDELDYELPPELIAQHPVEPRDHARLMVVDRARGDITMDVFHRLPRYLHRGDALVFNDTRVIRARLMGHKPTGGAVEIFLLRELGPGAWSALVRPSAKVKDGTAITLAGGHTATVEAALAGGQRRVRFDTPEVLALLEESGQIPLPPYIERDAPDPSDLRQYQTVYADEPGAVAAPTAGLHYTPELLQRLDAEGVHQVMLTLHVGYGTFKPIQTDSVAEHSVDAETYSFPPAAAERLNAVRASGGRIVAVGTTATRVLETQAGPEGFFPGAGNTELYIYPPFTFHGVDVLQTNFHLPRSSLLALVYAFAGRDLVRAAYARAIAERFRFYSYGDTTLLL